MEWEIFRIRRAQIARQLYEVLQANPPTDAVEIHEPDSIGATGIRFLDGYVLIQVEDAS